MIDLNNEKSTLRRYALDLRSRESGTADADAAIFAKITSLPQYISAKTVFAYNSFGGEADASRLVAHALDGGKRVALPRCDESENGMTFYEIPSLSELVRNSFGIMEPSPDTHCACTDTPDICIVPGLLFGLDGYRIGYGKGCYDRLLNSVKTYKIGICHDVFIMNSLPYDEYDQKVDMIITEKRIIRT